MRSCERGLAGFANSALERRERLGNSALDRLANASYQIVIEGSSYRERLSPHQALLGTVSRILTNNGD